MKKRILAALCLLAISVSACSKEDTATRAEKDLAELTEKTATVAPESTPTATPIATATPAPTKLELKGKIFDSSKSSMKNLVPLGQWTGVKKYNAVSDSKELCYVRITKVITDKAKVNEMVEAYNKQGLPENKIEIEDKYKDKFELVGVDYEIGYPTEWSARDSGITASAPMIIFAAKNMDGKVGFSTSDGQRYIGGYATTISLDKYREDRYVPGNIVKCHSVFQMVKGFDDYCLKLDLDEVYFKIK